MIAWQRQYNPLAIPVLCTEANTLPPNPDVAACIQTSYPIFRDPDEQGSPVSRVVIYRYWDDLCAAVEDDLAAKRRGEVRSG